jgi:putative NIF3 family GTP cyclohydrolase 1 type 2
VQGTGTFLPQEGAQPCLGKEGKLERADEMRIETIVPDSVRRQVIQAMLKAHPYEEVAYDLYPLDLNGRSFGIGRVGELDAAMPLDQFAERVKAAFDVPAVRVVGELQRPIRRAAVVGGAGRDFVRDAMFAGADVLITGDIDYHTAHDALAAGFSLIDAGHNIEKLLKPAVARLLGDRLKQDGYATEAIASVVHTDPFRYI